jgi:hypothetical protein
MKNTNYGFVVQSIFQISFFLQKNLNKISKSSLCDRDIQELNTPLTFFKYKNTEREINKSIKIKTTTNVIFSRGIPHSLFTAA